MAYNESEPLEVMVKRDPYVNDQSIQLINFEAFPYGVPDVVAGENGDIEVHNQIWDGYDLPDIPVGDTGDDILTQSLVAFTTLACLAACT